MAACFARFHDWVHIFTGSFLNDFLLDDILPAGEL